MSITKGPWRFDKGAFNYDGEQGLGSVVTDEDWPWYIAKIEFDGSGNHANARAISKVPEMVELLGHIAIDIVGAYGDEAQAILDYIDSGSDGKKQIQEREE